MKKFVTPAVEELKIAETANGFPSFIPEHYADFVSGNGYEVPIWGHGDGLSKGDEESDGDFTADAS